MKIISWNVNGLRNAIKHDYISGIIKKYNPDIICCSETKLSGNIEIINNYPYKYINNSQVIYGYAGTAIFSKIKPKHKFDWAEKLDNDGRLLGLEFNDYIIVNIYVPNAGETLQNLHWKIYTWFPKFINIIKKLQQTKPVIICGDFNVANNPIDLKNPAQNTEHAGYILQERRVFNKLLTECKLIDTYRYLYPNKIEYPYFSYRTHARERNAGWRIDYFLCDEKLKNKIQDSIILSDVEGSDHVPIILTTK